MSQPGNKHVATCFGDAFLGASSRKLCAFLAVTGDAMVLFRQGANEFDQDD